MKKVLFLMVSIVILGLVFAGCDVTKITAPDSSESLERDAGTINWTGQGSDSMNCDSESLDSWIHWVLNQAKDVTEFAQLVLEGTGSGTYLPTKITPGGVIHFLTPYFDVEGLSAVVNYSGSLGKNSQFVISDYCPCLILR